MTKRRFGTSTGVFLFALLALGGCSGGSSSNGGDGDDGGGGTSGKGGSSGSSGSSGSGGSSGGSPTCDFEPCGGDPTGSWTVRESCVDSVDDPLADVPQCAGALSVGVDVTGTISFDETQVTWDWMLVPGGVIDMNDACVSAIVGDSVNAVEVCPMLADAFVGSGTFDTASCEAQTATCLCTVTFPSEIDAGSDSYEIAGNQVILGSGEPSDFCVDGDTLELRNDTPDGRLTLIFERE